MQAQLLVRLMGFFRIGRGFDVLQEKARVGTVAMPRLPGTTTRPGSLCTGRVRILCGESCGEATHGCRGRSGDILVFRPTGRRFLGTRQVDQAGWSFGGQARTRSERVERSAASRPLSQRFPAGEWRDLARQACFALHFRNPAATFAAVMEEAKRLP